MNHATLLAEYERLVRLVSFYEAAEGDYGRERPQREQAKADLAAVRAQMRANNIALPTIPGALWA